MDWLQRNFAIGRTDLGKRWLWLGLAFAAFISLVFGSFAPLTIGVLLITAVVLFQTHKTVGKSSDAEMLRSVFERYEQAEMYDHIAAISEFGRSHSAELEVCQNLLDPTRIKLNEDDLTIAKMVVDDLTSQQNTGRRRVLNLYKHPWRMFEEGYINDSTLRLIAETNAVRLLYPTVMPASAAVHFVRVCEEDIGKFLRDRERFHWINKFRDWRRENMPSEHWDEDQ